METIKGGSGSGDVNSRKTVSVMEGLQAEGFEITTLSWLSDYEERWQKAREEWRDEIWRKLDAPGPAGGMRFFDAYAGTPFVVPGGGAIEKTDTDTAVYVIRRTAGEGADRFDRPGDYQLTDDERRELEEIAGKYAHVVLVLNIGGLIDLQVLDELPQIEAVLYMQQAGMEAGTAAAAILSGRTAPSGKLTDSWAYRYGDYPNSKTYSHNNGDVWKEYYHEDIFVGYRYFDTFDVPVRYGFGFGLSYTDFSIRTIGITHYDLGTKDARIGLKAAVKNTGSVPGKEVVQVYAAPPQGRLPGEYRRLAAFGKTRLLSPGEEQELELFFPVASLASYDEKLPGFVLKEGLYGLFAGNSLEASVLSATLYMPQEIVTERTKNVCPVQEDFDRLAAPAEAVEEKRRGWSGAAASLPQIILNPHDIVTVTHVYDGAYGLVSDEARAFVDKLSTEQLIRLATGDIDRSQSSALGSAGSSVPGAAAQTSACAEDDGLPFINLADGPAGLRLNQSYPVRSGRPVKQSFMVSIENGFLSREAPIEGRRRAGSSARPSRSEPCWPRAGIPRLCARSAKRSRRNWSALRSNCGWHPA